MHTTFTKNDTWFLHDGDARGGPVIIRSRTKAALEAKKENADEEYAEIVIEYDDLLMLVADQIRLAKITVLEQMDDAKLLGYPVGD